MAKIADQTAVSRNMAGVATHPDLDMLHTEARAQLDNQLSSFDALDVKAGIVLALAAAEAALVAAAIAIPRPSAVPAAIAVLAAIAVALSFFAFAYVSWKGLRGLALIQPAVGPKLADLADAYAAGEGADLVKARVISTLHQDFQQNETVLYRPKVVALRNSLRAVAVQTVAALVGLLLLAAPSLFPPSGSETASHPAHSVGLETSPAAPSVAHLGSPPARESSSPSVHSP